METIGERCKMENENDNSVKSLKTVAFERRSYQEKLKVKELGPDQPDSSITQQSKEGDSPLALFVGAGLAERLG